MVLRRRDGTVERIEERGVQRAEGKFVDDMREIECCRKETELVVVVGYERGEVMESGMDRDVSRLMTTYWVSGEVKREAMSDVPL